MDSQVEKRKLAAVMFADIEGYTALFQKNETGAFEMLEQHRKDLKEISEKHKGHIVKYYGDGSLTLFTSVIEAAKCAIDLQLLSIKHGISLRIGLHMGEMIEKNKDVYGDAVNIASRIQAIGISGSILISKTVEDELKNHPDITTRSLGLVYLKNVTPSIEIFAVTHPGLAVPHALPGAGSKKSRWLAYLIIPVAVLAMAAWFFRYEIKSKFSKFGEECIIIPPFVSHVPNGELDFFSKMASMELIKAMGESAKANIIPYSTMLLRTNANIGSFIDNPALSKRLGAEIQIRGEYTLEGKNMDTLRISLSILDLKQDRLLQTPIKDIRCPSANKRECLEEAKNILVGYWKSKGDSLFHMTTDSAYINFEIAQHIWANPDRKEDIRSYLKKAIQHDPKFLDAWFLYLNLLHNEMKYERGLDTIALIKDLFPNLDKRPENQLAYYKADFTGKNTQAFRLFLNEYNPHRNDLFLYNTGMVMAMEYLNDPLVATQLYHKRYVDFTDLSTCTYCYTGFNFALRAYLQLNDLEKARELAEQIKPYASKEEHFIGLLKYFVMVNDTMSINEMIRSATKAVTNDDGKPYDDEEQYLCHLTARMATVQGNLSLRDQYVSRAIRLYEKKPNVYLAKCYLLIGQLEKAKSIYLDKLKASVIKPETFAYLGIIYAKEGNVAFANKMIEKLEAQKDKYDMGYTSYYQARIKANLGEFDHALQYLKNALSEGIRFLPTSTFLNDPDMIIMNTNKEYLSLLAANRLNKIE
jgi:class 3 adenylate cyclase